jgi:hypothetical protein
VTLVAGWLRQATRPGCADLSAEAATRGSASVESMSPPFRSAALAARYALDVAAARAGLKGANLCSRLGRG